MPPQVLDIEKTNECQACLNRRSAFLCVLLFLCSSVSDSINPLKLHSARDTSSLARIRDLIFMCYTVQTRISATIIIRFLVPARNDSVEAKVTTLSYNSYVLYIRTYAPTKTAQCPRYVISGQDQRPYLHVLHIACEDKRQPSSYPSYSCKRHLQTH